MACRGSRWASSPRGSPCSHRVRLSTGTRSSVMSVASRVICSFKPPSSRRSTARSCSARRNAASGPNVNIDGPATRVAEQQPLRGRRALVTGASSGLGEELARQLAALGADLVIAARRGERLDEIATAIRRSAGVDVRIEVIDLSDPEAARMLFERTEGIGNAIDILMNNAGFGAYDTFQDVAWPVHETMLQVHVLSLTHLTHLIARAMVARGRGCIVNVASTSGFVPCPRMTVYAASKAYVRQFTEALAIDLRGTGVTATVVCPGPLQTSFLTQAGLALKWPARPIVVSVSDCARMTIAGALAGRSSVVAGRGNRLLLFVARWCPRPWRARIASSLFDLGVDKTSAPETAGPPGPSFHSDAPASQ